MFMAWFKKVRKPIPVPAEPSTGGAMGEMPAMQQDSVRERPGQKYARVRPLRPPFPDDCITAIDDVA